MNTTSAHCFRPDPAIKVPPHAPEVYTALTSVAAQGADALGLAHPHADNPGQWVISLIAAAGSDSGDVLDFFVLAGAGAWEQQQPRRLARELAAHGYGLPDAEGGRWGELDDGGRVAPLRRVAEGQVGR